MNGYSIHLSKFLFCLLLLGLSTALYAQTNASDPAYVRVVTKDGNSYIGTLVEEDVKELVLMTEELGRITIKKENIRSLENYNRENDSFTERRYKNPQPTRYFFGTNALPIEKGKGYYQNAWIFINNANMGITDNFSVGAGLIPIFFLGETALPIWILPKFSVPVGSEKVHLAVGGVFGGIIGDGGGGGGGLAYSALTLGDTDHNGTLGIGYGYADGSWADVPLINVSGMARISDNVYLISENYFVKFDNTFEGLLFFGARVTRPSFAVDFAIIRPTEPVDMIGVPWLGVTLPFGY